MKIPATMMTQHPDNAKEYVSVQQEPEEAVFSLRPQNKGGLGIDEVMIDFEGKLTPYHQPIQIALDLLNNDLIPGKDVFITPRLSSADKETVFRQIMCIMAVVETNISVYEKTKTQAIKEVIVPMCESSKDLIDVYSRIKSVIELGNKNFDIKFNENSIGIIPLFEDISSLVNIDKVIEDYVIGLDYKPEYIRFMIGRSDSALSYGLVSSVLAVVLSIFKSRKWSEKSSINIYPIMGCGTLPFRGQLTYENIDNFLKTYSGVKTITVQSALRYDHGFEKTQRLVEFINDNLDKYEVRNFTEEDIDLMLDYIGIFTKHYLSSFIKIADTVSNISLFIPKNRDRLAASKKGLSYHREFVDMNKLIELIKDSETKNELLAINTNINTSIPRAITFTASMYTIGMPPEFLGAGRALSEIKNKYGDFGIKKLYEFYPQINSDFEFAAKYTNPSISKRIFPDEIRKEFEIDFELTNKLLNLNIDLESNIENNFYHTLLKTARPILLHLLGKESQILDNNCQEYNILKELLIKLGSIRGGLG